MTTPAERAELLRWHPFELDRFQVEALDAIDADRSVLVAAPTGSGKTVVAEYAIARALDAGTKAFYTTPIKALSNQKYLDLRRRHGRDRVGLLTGDTSLDGEAAAVVMTTEVLRNMLYERSRTIDRLSVVVLDEVHYLQDPYRGPVWEEIILHLPPHVRLVCLSATVSNAEELAAWLASVRGPTEVIVEHHRPVELHQHLVVADREQRELRVVPVLRGGRPNPDGARYDAEPGPRRGGRRRYATPRRDDVIELLSERDLLPALWFIFSRAGCEDAVRRARQDGVRLAPPEDRERIRAIVEQHTATLDDRDLDVLGYDAWLDALEVGIAAHHAGMVPAFKETVEHLFVEGLVRLVFATETLALGINMPARAVIIEQLSKYTGDGHALLTPSEFTQLTGRAGRRGLDPEGHAFVLWSPFVRFDEMAALAGSRAFELRSAFRPTYNMAANLVRRTTQEEAHALLARSFGQFQADRGVVAVAQRLADRGVRLAELRSEAACEHGDVAEYARLSDAAREEQRSQRTAASPAASMRNLRPGEVVAAPGIGERLAVVGVSQRRGGGTRVRAVDAGGHLRTFGDRDLPEPLERLGAIELPQPHAPRDVAFRKAVGRALRAQGTSPRRGGDRGPATSRRRASGAERAVAAHPVHACADRDEHVRAVRRVARAEREVQGLQRTIDAATDSLGRRFDRILEVLDAWGYVDGWALTDRGERLARTYHENDLLVAEAVASGVLDGLDAPAIAAVASCFTYEHRRRDAAPAWPARPAAVSAAIAEVERIGSALAALERTHKVPPSRPPDDGFARYAHEWAGGAPLDDVLGRDDPMPAGDFVRNAKILMDLLRQIASLATDERTAEAALEAAGALERGVVAVAGDVGTGEDDEDEDGAEVVDALARPEVGLGT